MTDSNIVLQKGHIQTWHLTKTNYNSIVMSSVANISKGLSFRPAEFHKRSNLSPNTLS